VQLKGRLTFSEKYRGQDLFVCFRDEENWYLYPHDELLAQVLGEGLLKGTDSWDVHGGYSFPGLSKQLRVMLESYRLES
jgi:hypothetical protein